MNALFFIIRRQLKNIVRNLANKPLALVGYIFIGIMITGALIAALFMPSGNVRHGPNELFSAIFTGLVVIAVYSSLKQGVEKGSTYFRFADVNLVFTAPIKSNKVLLYGFIKRVGTSVIIVLFSIFQIPNVKNNFVLKDYGVWVILMAILLYSLLSQIPGMVLYAYTSASSKRRNIAKRVLDALAILFAGGFLVQITAKDNFTGAIIQYLNSDIFTFIPIVGQLRSIASAAVYGIDQSFYVSIIILIAMIFAFLLILYKTDADYYEDVLAATELVEKRIKAKREGKGTDMVKKARRVKGGFLSEGARAIFDKHLLEYRKTSYFMFFDKSSIFIIIAGIVFKFLMPDGVGNIFYILFFGAYMLFLFTIQGKWPNELEKPFLFLIPESNGSKLLYCTLTENIKNLLDGITLFTISYFLFKANIYVTALCIISYTLYGAIYIYCDILSRRLFGKIHSKPMLIFMKMFVSGFVVLPGILLMFIINYGLGNEVLAALSITAWNLFVVVTLFLFSRSVLDNIEIAQ